MTGNFIAEYSDTTIYFYPSDKSLLYRANALKFRLGIENLRDLAEAINKSYEDDEKEGMKVPSKKVTESELASLLSAASPVSPDKTVNEDGDTMVVDITSKASSEDIERNYAKREMYLNTAEALKSLTILQRKIIRLKGVDL
jgi:DNA-directed RNA polymerase sigma subunit (sigma70/sigma32)